MFTLARVSGALGTRTAILFGGLAGSAVRVGLERTWAPAIDELPWATLAVNLAGVFLLGLILRWLLHPNATTQRAAPLLATGVMGRSPPSRC